MKEADPLDNIALVAGLAFLTLGMFCLIGTTFVKSPEQDDFLVGCYLGSLGFIVMLIMLGLVCKKLSNHGTQDQQAKAIDASINL